MIRADLSTVISIYLFILVVAPLIIWSFFGYDRGDRGFSDSNKSFWQCSVCTHVYEVNKDQSISVCPNCKSYNRKEEGL